MASPRKRQLALLREALSSLPPHERKSYARGWLQVDKVFYKPKRRLKKNDPTSIILSATGDQDEAG